MLTAEHWPFIYLHPPGRIQLKVDFVTPVRQKITRLDQVGVLRLQAQHLGVAYFPQADETVVDSLLTQRLWDERGVQAHWMPKFGLAAGAFVNLNGAELQIMAMQEASHSEFENAFEEALADPLWVARHAEIARESMLSKVQFAAMCMEFAWQRAMKIPETRPLERWRAMSISGFLRGASYSRTKGALRADRLHQG